MVRHVYTKRYQVAKLFLGKLMTEHKDFKGCEWEALIDNPKESEIQKTAYGPDPKLIWAKNSRGDIFQAIVFKDGLVFHAHTGDVVDDITHFSYIGEA